MNNKKLLVRVYDVGFGDCIYIRLPDKDKFYHILIDCGSSGPAEPTLKNALDDVRSMLPKDQSSNKCLDLLVVTHPHADHIRGFNPKWFEGITIRHIWLSVFMKKDHPQAEQSIALAKLTDKAANSLRNRGLHLRYGLDTLLMNSIWNPGAIKALRVTLPKDSNIEPVYMCRDIAKKLKEKDRKKHKLIFSGRTTCLQDFQESGTCLRVLAPEWDIDGYYLGKESPNYKSLFALYLKDQPKAGSGEGKQSTPQPQNISKRDFRQLCNRIYYSALAFSSADKELKNNTSVVLLLEWRGKRLLFTGDAEWKGNTVKKGHRNSCWDVMLKMNRKEDHLSKPLDFLKVGHHGSINGTPFVDKEGVEQKILDKIIPRGGKAQVVISTLAGKHGEKKKVPYPNLMKELGLRAANACKYPKDPDIPNDLQPQRTDGLLLETDREVPCIDVKIPA